MVEKFLNFNIELLSRIETPKGLRQRKILIIDIVSQNKLNVIKIMKIETNFEKLVIGF